MKVRQIMSPNVVGIGPGETVAVAARTLTQYNIGALPVCSGGRICGLVTDRDLVIRCVAAGRSPEKTRVEQIMTRQITTVSADMEVGAAAHLMGRLQIRRLPVTENGRLCGMLSLGDMARLEEGVMDAADALSEIAGNQREG